MDNFENGFVLDNQTNQSVDVSNIELLKKKNKRLKRINIVLSVFTFLFLFIFLTIGIIVFLFAKRYKLPINVIKNRLSATSSDTATNSNASNLIDLERITEKLNYIDNYVDLFFYYDKDNKKIEDGIFTGYVSALNDKYGEYMPAKTYDNFVEETNGEYYGIGCVVSTNKDTNEYYVAEVYEGSPGQKAGVMVGDIFKTVDGIDVTEYTLNQIVDLVKGKEGTTVVIGFYRESEKSVVNISCVRGKIEVKRVEYEILENDIGYINITEFTGKTESQFKNCVDELTSKDAKGLIIDLRNNPGGELMTVLNMLDYCLRDTNGKFTLNQNEFKTGATLLVYMRDKTQIVDSYYCDDKHEVKLPIVILINGSSASASELFTQCMKDYNMATVIGQRSYGKGVMQNIQPLPDGSAIRLTVAGYFPPSGYNIDNHGVLPDIGIDEDGNEILYDEDGNEYYYNQNKKWTIFRDGKEISEDLPETDIHYHKISTFSNVVVAYDNPISTISDADSNIIESTSSDIIKEVVDNKNNNTDVERNSIVIYDDGFKYQEEDWFIDLDEKYTDKVLLQGIVSLKDY